MTSPNQVPNPLRVRPSFRHYDWGDSRYIAELLQLDARQQPVAEAWYGAHPLAPAGVEVAAATMGLDAVIHQDAKAWLGERVKTRYGNLPYLLKILAAAKPLSIQVHPNRIQAREGFEREERKEIPRNAPHRFFRDPSPKPELYVALTPSDALCGFREPEAIAQTLAALPEIREHLPPFGGPFAIRALLSAYFALPDSVVQKALSAILHRLEATCPESDRPSTDHGYWVLRAHRLLRPHGLPDRGLFLIFLLNHLQLKPGQAIFLPAGVPHAYLQGAGVELMANSDNVLRAGLTSKAVNPDELLRMVRFDGVAPAVFDAEEDEPGEGAVYAVPSDEFQLARHTLGSEKVERVSTGPETLLCMNGEVRIISEGGELTLSPGEGCVLANETRYALQASSFATLYRASTPFARPRPRAQSGRALKGPTELPRQVDSEAVFLTAIERNIEVTEVLFESGDPPAVVGTVSGSKSACAFWQRQLDLARPAFRARKMLSLHEDLPVNQAFGLLLLWQRLRPHLQAGEGALMAFVFGEGSRAAPLTEAESGQKPAIASFVAVGHGVTRRYLSIVELALRYFSPVESYLRRSGFDGIVVKWGDEVQIPTADLSGHDARFAGADIVRFVSMRPMTAHTAENKDWVGVDVEGNITAFIPRRPLEEMRPLADRGVFQRRGDQLFGGVNLGSIALSRALLDVLLEEFGGEVNDGSANRKLRPDLDPQFFTALTIAKMSEDQRQDAWEQALSESEAMRKLNMHLPGLLPRLVATLNRFEQLHNRPIRIVAMDFEDQYWGDIGQHRQIYDFYLALGASGPEGRIARALAGLPESWDENGNLLSGQVKLGPSVKVKNSVLIDVQVEEGSIDSCVLVGTRALRFEGTEAFDIGSTAVEMRLMPRSGTYKTLSEDRVEAGEGERIATVLEPDSEYHLRVHEETNLRNRAETYDIPILGNPSSFREAHDRVGYADPEEVNARRACRRSDIEELITSLSSTD